jgi:hypothetical protein
MPRQRIPPDRAASATASATPDTNSLQRGESRYPRAASATRQDASPASDRGIEVTTPAEPPSLTPGAARVLLRMLLDTARQQGVMPPCEPDRTDE